eukprot:scaffold123396_cov30-Tisochrysis_lutea.AAC.15
MVRAVPLRSSLAALAVVRMSGNDRRAAGLLDVSLAFTSLNFSAVLAPSPCHVRAGCVKLSPRLMFCLPRSMSAVHTYFVVFHLVSV